MDTYRPWLLVALPARLDLHGTMQAVAAGPEELSPWRRRGLALLTSPSAGVGAPAAMDEWSDRERWGAWAIAPLVWHLELCAAAFEQGQLLYLVMLHIALAIDVVSAGVVGHQAWWHLNLVLQGRRTLAPEDDADDAGYRANWVRVFGPTRLWLLPLKAGGPTTADGLAWGDIDCHGIEHGLQDEKRKAT